MPRTACRRQPLLSSRWHALFSPELAQATHPVRSAHGAFSRRLYLAQPQPSRAGPDMRQAVADRERAVVDTAPADARGLEHADALTMKSHERTGIRRVRAHATHELLSRTREVELPLAGLELRGESYSSGVLRPAHQLPGEIPGHLALEKL